MYLGKMSNLCVVCDHLLFFFHLPFVPHLSSSGPKKWTIENVPLGSTCYTDKEPQSGVHATFPSLGRQRGNGKILATFVWFTCWFVEQTQKV